MLEEAWRVFRNREDVDREKLTKVMATATVVALEQRGMIHKRGFRGRGRGLGNVVRKKSMCVLSRGRTLEE